MNTIIHGVPVTADPALSWEEINQIVTEIVEAWAWEGRQLGKVELVCDGQLIHVCTYGKPFIKLIPLKQQQQGVKKCAN